MYLSYYPQFFFRGAPPSPVSMFKIEIQISSLRIHTWFHIQCTNNSPSDSSPRPSPKYKTHSKNQATLRATPPIWCSATHSFPSILLSVWLQCHAKLNYHSYFPERVIKPHIYICTRVNNFFSTKPHDTMSGVTLGCSVPENCANPFQ